MADTTAEASASVSLEDTHAETRVSPEDWDEHRPLAGRPQIVVGGPGTGKTQFLCNRVGEAVQSNSLSPDEIIVLTFSRQGANDIRERLFDVLGPAAYRVNVSTYHSLAMRIVEAHSAVIGWDGPPSILTGSEQEQFVASLLEDEDPGTWSAAYKSILGTAAMASEVADFILRCHEHLLTPRDVEAFHRDQWRGIPAFYDRYLLAQVAAGRTDYGRILADAVHVVDSDTEISASYKLVVADEYQDTSPAQARLLLSLAANTQNLLVAADPYQSIYSFRGTDLNNVFDFPERTEQSLGISAERLILTTSFRVPSEILSAAVSVTARELPGGAGKVLSTRRGGTVSAHVFGLEAGEADWISADIEHVHLKDGVPLERIAVFFRAATSFADLLSRALDRREIPHTYDESRLSDQPIVRFVRDLVSAAADADDEDTIVRRVLQSPYIGVPPGAIIAMDRRRAAGESWPDIIASSVADGRFLADLLTDSSWAISQPAPAGLWHLWSTLPQFVRIATDESGVNERRAWTAFAQALDRLEERVPDATLLDHDRLVGRSEFEADPLFDFRLEKDRGVTVTTLHRAKGTSFEVVYIAQAVEGMLPDLRATDSLLGSRHLNPHLPTGTAAYRAFRLDEERRLAYTAMTRASSKVVWTATSDDGAHGQRPSRFLPLVATVAGRDHVTEPLTVRSFEAALRRSLHDPHSSDVDRLAAAVVLADGPSNGLGEPLERFGTRQRGHDSGIVPEELQMSPSQANSYKACPRRYAVERYLMTRSRETDAMRFGSLIHKVLEEAEREALDAGHERATADDALEWLDRLWDEHGFADDSVGRAWRTRAETMLRDMYRLWPSSACPVSFETSLSMTIDGTPWYGLADRIEANDSGVLVVDYKTGVVVSKAEAAESIQLGYYVMAASENAEVVENGEVVGAAFWYPTRPLKHSIATREFDMANLGRVRDTMIEIATAIRNETFDPAPGTQCDTCDVELICPARAAGAEAFA